MHFNINLNHCVLHLGGKLCGNTAPTNTYRSLGKSMTVYFQSDGSDQFSGFKMVVTPFHTGKLVIRKISHQVVRKKGTSN